MEDLDGALLRDLADTGLELLALHRVLALKGGEVLGRERRDALKADLFVLGADRIADGVDAGVEHADDVSGVGLVDDLALLGHHLLRLRELDGLSALHVVVFLVALKLARADAHERDAVAVRLVHVRLDLEYEGGEMVVRRLDRHAIGKARKRRRCEIEKARQKLLHAEVHQRRAEENGAQIAAADKIEIKFVPRAVEKLHIVAKRAVQPLAERFAQARLVIHGKLRRVDGAAARVTLRKRENFLLLAVVHALEVHAAADRPVHRVRADAELLFELFEQIVGAARLAVHLVDEREDGDMPHGADLEELARLRLDALGRVDDHDGAVRRHKRAVGVLGEVLMAGGVENVDAVAVIFKLEHGRRDGNAALLFQLHPVGDRMARRRLALYRAGELDRPSVEKELFRQCRFARVRVGDDRKRPPPRDFPL